MAKLSCQTIFPTEKHLLQAKKKSLLDFPL